MRSRELQKSDFERYSGKWVALSHDERVVRGSGRSPRIALKKARLAGETSPTLMKVPKEPGAYILFSS